MKKLMIMGAGVYQVPMIKRAKEMGIYTIAVSIPGPYPGFQYADEACYLDTTDSEAVLREAKERKIDGIVTAGTDVAVITIGEVCDALGLCGLSAKSARIASDKLLMKKVFEENHVRTARYREVLFEEDPQEKIRDLQYPLIVKTVDSSGSRGISRVNDPSELPAAMEYAHRYTHKDYCLIEEFLTGREFGAQAYVLDGEIQFILPHGDEVFQGDTGVPAGHFAPYDISPEILEDAREQTAAAVRAMGLNNCAVNADFILCDGKTYVLELGGRSGATCLAELVSIYYGFDYYEKMILAALGEKPDFSSDLQVPNASRLLMSRETGVIRELRDDNPKDERIVEIQFDYGCGDHVRKFHIGPDRIGHVVTKGATLEEAFQVLDEACSRICIDVEPDKGEMTD